MTRSPKHKADVDPWTRPDPENVTWRDWVGSAALIAIAAGLGYALNVWGA
jgi:hypothetical protein